TARSIQSARAILQENSRTREWNFIRHELQKTPSDALNLRPSKVALLSSFSTEFLHAPFVAYGFTNGFKIDIYQAGFSQFRQEIIDTKSRLYAFSPDVVILAVEGKDWIPELYSDYDDAVEGGLSSAIEQAQREINALIDAVRKFT